MGRVAGGRGRINLWVRCKPLFKANLLLPLCPPKVARGRINLWVACEPFFKRQVYYPLSVLQRWVTQPSVTLFPARR